MSSGTEHLRAAENALAEAKQSKTISSVEEASIHAWLAIARKLDQLASVLDLLPAGQLDVREVIGQ